MKKKETENKDVERVHSFSSFTHFPGTTYANWQALDLAVTLGIPDGVETNGGQQNAERGLTRCTKRSKDKSTQCDHAVAPVRVVITRRLFFFCIRTTPSQCTAISFSKSLFHLELSRSRDLFACCLRMSTIAPFCSNKLSTGTGTASRSLCFMYYTKPLLKHKIMWCKELHTHNKPVSRCRYLGCASDQKLCSIMPVTLMHYYLMQYDILMQPGIYAL
ncbi:hypothetical protein EDB87DRAFT_975042 [Lactarius vividus]|nr:hypothetical protein EDB87DRAFT_975042 [Lactarius vividus]